MKGLLLDVENVSKTFGVREILKDINFQVHRGDIIGFLGFSGSGKTTLLNIISGFLKPSSGNIYFNFENKGDLISIYRESFKYKSVIGFSAQKPSFYPELTIQENMHYYGILSGMEKEGLKEKIDEILILLDLIEHKKVLGKNLSQGMKKRLDLACSLVHDPIILILDEPTSNLDFKLREEILHYIKKINHKKGIAIIFVSHYLNEIEGLCNKVLMINYSCHMISDVHRLKNKFEHFIKHEKKEFKLNPLDVTEVKNEED